MSDSAESVAKAFAQAINQHDPDRLADLMAENHRFIDSLGNAVEGREKMRAGWAGYFRMVPDYSITVEHALADGATVVLLGVAGGTYAPREELKPENQWKTLVAIRAQIDGSKVSEWQVYADNEPMRTLMKKNR